MFIVAAFVLVAVPLQTNHPPTVKIETPVGNVVVAAGAPVSWQIQVTDPEDGDSRYDEIDSREVIVEVAPAPPSGGSGARAPVIDSALTIMAVNNCYHCHQFNSRSLGPSFFEIAKRYPATTANTDTLIQRVKNGSSGIWGRVEKMPSHPELSSGAIRATVRWILRNAARPDRSWYFGTSGILHVDHPGAYTLTATYTDHGTKEEPGARLSGSDRITINVRAGTSP
jgi:cytochrome c